MAFTFAQFRTLLTQANPSFATAGDSALTNVLSYLQTIPAFGGASPTVKQQIQQAYAVIPHHRQLRYKNAFDYMKREITPTKPFADAIPVNPGMALVEFWTYGTSYQGRNAAGATKLITDPEGCYNHVCELTYKSSNGLLASLANVGTRENVTYRNQPWGPPFNDVLAATPMHFTKGADTNSGGASGHCKDDHSTVLPSIVCANPRVPGSVVMEQWYEYTTDGATWHHIPNAAYLIEKSVKKGGPTGWIFSFKKSNWGAHNPFPFHLELEYTVGAPPEYMPIQGSMTKAPNSKVDPKQYAYKVVSLR